MKKRSNKAKTGGAQMSLPLHLEDAPKRGKFTPVIVRKHVKKLLAKPDGVLASELQENDPKVFNNSKATRRFFSDVLPRVGVKTRARREGMDTRYVAYRPRRAS
jgi:hypothetical protein